ncbi:hypothetical protein N7470_004011 [Penicillium chermesinum]|nr:hypothetical protein N7470_004011 [Penicillium chermesinum]
MSSRLLHPDEYELASRSSLDSEGTFNLDDDDFESQVPPRSRYGHERWPWLRRIVGSTFGRYRRLKPNRPLFASTARPTCFRRLFFRRCCYYLHVTFGIILALVLLTSVFLPSYTSPPARYSTLRGAARATNAAGRGNPRNEKVFIAASIYDRGGELASGKWGTQLLHLIDMLGEKNVFVSIYENDSGEEGERALRELERLIGSPKAIVFEEHMDLGTLPTPLEADPKTRYDKLLYLNDVLFDPIDALQLLFSTNANEDGVAQYRAACAVDFDNPFKFYDTYATRDLQGYSMGLPFYPWFTTSGKGDSRKDVQQGKDAVRVRSCWGGMVAFDANIQDPQTKVDEITDTGIYMNPYVRTAYDSRTLSWLGVTRRFEKLYSFIHNLGNHLVGLPWYNPRREEVPGQSVQETVWVPNETQDGGGSFQNVDRTAGNDGFCGRRGLQVIVEHRKPGQKGFESIPVPSL